MTRPSPTRVIETGIRALDLYAPLLEGGVLAITGTPGAGQVVLTLEVAHNLVSRQGARAEFHTPEVEKLEAAVRESGVQATVLAGSGPIRLELTLEGRMPGSVVVGEVTSPDSWAVLSVDLMRIGQMPAIEPSRSGTLHDLGAHTRIAERARRAVAAPTGARAGSISAFMRQWFHVGEPWTGQPAEYTSLEDTLAAVQRFLGPATDEES